MIERLNKIQEYNQEKYIPRNILVNRLELLIQEILKSDVRLFGSCTTGLMLPDSDIDMIIIEEQKQEENILQKMDRVLSRFKFVVKKQLILTAQVPVLKIEVNPFTKFDDIIDDNDDMLKNLKQKHDMGSAQYNLKYISEQYKYVKEQSIIHMDLTTERQIKYQKQNMIGHLGILSSNLIINWMNIYPCLQNVSILIKQFIYQQKMNNNYGGGFSSYQIIVMVVGVIKMSIREGVDATDCYTLMKRFYQWWGSQFNYQDMVLAIYHPNTFVEVNQKNTQLVIYDPIIPEKNLTYNVTLFAEIFRIFKKVGILFEEFDESVRQDQVINIFEEMGKIN